MSAEMTQAAEQGSPPPAPPCPACGASEFTPAYEKRGYRLERCSGCGLVRVNPLPTVEELVDFYAESYRESAYQKFARAESIRRAIAEQRFARIAREVPRARRWLDVGASTGAFVRTVLSAAPDAGVDGDAMAGSAHAGQHNGLVAEGIELSAEAVLEARKAGLAVSRSSIEDFRTERAYDVVTAFDVLEHLREPQVLLARARDWLAPGGILALTVPDIGSVPARLMGRFWYYVDPPGHLHYFDQDSLGRFLERNRYRVLAIEPAYKVLTLDYSFEVLRRLNPGLAPIARALGALLPASVLARERRFGIGELLALASPRREPVA